MAALAAPAWGQGDEPTLRRDGSKAVPFVAEVGTASGVSSERTATEAGQSVDSSAALTTSGASSERTATEAGQSVDSSATLTTSGASSGFDWGDAAIGAGLGAVAALLTVGAVGAVRRRSTTRAASAAAAR